VNAVVEAVNHAARLWWTHAFHITWQGTLLGALVLGILRFGRRWPVSIRCGLVLIALAKFAVPATWTAPTGVFSRLGPALAAHDAAGAQVAPADQPTLCWQAPLMGLHALGIFAVAGWIAVQSARASLLARRADVRIPVRLRRRFARLARQMGLKPRVRLMASRRPVTPMAFGLLRPTVLIPASLLGDDHVETILAHELAHHRRGDLWLSRFGAAMAAAWWFNPVVWLLGRALRQVCEDGCDDMLLGRHIAAGERYCQALIQAARTLRRQISPGGAAAFAERPHSLGGRIRRIMDPRIRRGSRRPVATAVGMIALAAFLLPGLPSAPGSEDSVRPAALASPPPLAAPVMIAEAPAYEAAPAIRIADRSSAPLAWPGASAGILPASGTPLPWWRTAPIAQPDPVSPVATIRPVHAPPPVIATRPLPAVAASGQFGLPAMASGGLGVDLCLSPAPRTPPASSSDSGQLRPIGQGGGRTPLEWSLSDYLDPSVFRVANPSAPAANGDLGADSTVDVSPGDGLGEPNRVDPQSQPRQIRFPNLGPACLYDATHVVGVESDGFQSDDPSTIHFDRYWEDPYPVFIWPVEWGTSAGDGHVVPEPAALALLLIGAAGVLGRRKRSR